MKIKRNVVINFTTTNERERQKLKNLKSWVEELKFNGDIEDYQIDNCSLKLSFRNDSRNAIKLRKYVQEVLK